MSGVYVWKNDQLLVFPDMITTKRAKELGIINCYCLDTYFENSASSKYGMFIASEDGKSNVYWLYQPFEAFPKDFRIQLLLLGVS